MKKYSVHDRTPEDVAKKLEEFSPIVRDFLYRRGLVDLQTAKDFLNPDYSTGVHDPFLFKGMDRAVQRILSAIEKGEVIAIWSDYDADGIPGAVVWHDLFRRIGYANTIHYIPHRNDEGFGLNNDGVKELSSKGVKLIMTIDCGITDVSEVELANSLGVDVIITDHHLPGDNLPKAYAIINAKQSGDEYPFKELCGAGVAFKVAQALLKKKDFGLKNGVEKWFLDMVGIATLSDMVPLIGENRIFAHYGLAVLKKTPRLGLQSLFSKLKVSQKNLSEDDIGFTITPRINAASRMGVPMDAFYLLSATNIDSATKYADHLDHINNERKGVVANMVKEARKNISNRKDQDGMDKVVVIGNPDWKPSLLGLVASSLVEDHGKPVFVWGREGASHIKGSCRGSGNISVVEIMNKAKESFLDYGGHTMSGGFSVALEKIHNLESSLARACVELEKETKEPAPVLVDAILSLEDVNWDFYRDIEKFAPFGVGNPKPIFIFKSVSPVSVKIFGKEKNHLEINFVNKKGKKISAIAFFAGHDSFDRQVAVDTPIDLVATFEKSNFRNYPELRLRIVDVI